MFSDAVRVTDYVAADVRTIGKLGRILEAIVLQMRYYAAIYLGLLRNMMDNFDENAWLLNREINWTHSEFRSESFP